MTQNEAALARQKQAMTVNASSINKGMSIHVCVICNIWLTMLLQLLACTLILV